MISMLASDSAGKEKMAKILLVEDDSDLVFTVSEFLKSEQHSVEYFTDGREGLDRLLCCTYDLIILDWSLPGLSGMNILQEFRARGGKTPILFLTARSTINDKESGLDAGADDYLTKPFDLRELSARLRALLRRPQVVTANTLKVKDLVLDPATRKVSKRGVEIHLLPIDFALLEFFMRHPDQIFSNNALLERVWHSESDATGEALRSALKRIRYKIDDSECAIIENIPRVGYRMPSGKKKD
ncbi:MAG TPA: response regulator transcription factor [Candidatus Melainabacteria bacterium]|jgi:DNA-binding response OmpR family regulator|nr:response regulator transcription factor [Candidatus Melainabacteria bacterium]